MSPFPQEPFRYVDLADLGISRSALAGALADGRLVQCFRGVYLPAELVTDLRARVAAVRLQVGPLQIACDRTAAWLHGIDLYRFSEHQGVPVLETCVRRGATRTRIREQVHGMTRDLADHDIELSRGLVLTTPLRTALDLGCVLYRRDALAVLDQFRRRFGISEETLALEAQRFRGRRGVRQLRALIPLTTAEAESVRETWTRLALLDAGLPAPVVQYWWQDVFRIDLAYPRQRIAIEYDGEEFHLGGQRAAYDQERRDRMRADGWVFVVVRSGDFTGPRLDRWIDEVRTLVRERSSDNRRW